ncbi:TPA: hypothetical protein ACQYC6_004091 [Vibrio parahaemolyticus]
MNQITNTEYRELLCHTQRLMPCALQWPVLSTIPNVAFCLYVQSRISTNNPTLIEDCLMVENIIEHSGEVYIKNAPTVDHVPALPQWPRGSAGGLVIIVSESYLTDKAKQVANDHNHQ